MLDFNDAPRPHVRFDLDAIVERLRNSAEIWVPQHFPNGRRCGNDWRLANIKGDPPRKNGSCIIALRGDHAGDWIDHDGGHGGGPLDALAHATGLVKRDLYAYAARVAGWTRESPAAPTSAAPATPRRDVSAEMNTILSGAVPLAGTHGAAYLAARGLAIPPCPDLMFQPDLTHWESRRGFPGLVALVRGEDGRVIGLHRTFLDHGKPEKAAVEPPRKSLGPIEGGAVRLAPMDESGIIGISEGIETGLAVMSSCDGLPVWAAISAGGMERIRLPPEVTRVFLLADHDRSGAGMRAARAAAARLLSEGRQVRIAMPPRPGDFNDVLRSEGAEAVQNIVREAKNAAPTHEGAGQVNSPVTLEDFLAFMPMHRYIFVPTGDLWPAASVNARVPPVTAGSRNEIPPSHWLDENRPVEQITWIPGAPRIIRGSLMTEGGMISRPGCAVFNLYRPSLLEPGDPEKAGPWIDHLKAIYPESWEHICRWMAHRVQKPGEKINHVLVLGGNQGIGKDTLLHGVRYAIGPWNMAEITPVQLAGRFNGWVKSVILRISEARDLGDIDRYAFYEHMKIYAAAPPEVLRVDEKNLREYTVPNVTGVLITTNHRTNGIWLPADDRRHYVAWSDARKEHFGDDYWRRFYGWYEQDGCRHVAAWLAAFDLTGFDPAAPPPQTAAWREIADAGRAPESTEIADALDLLGNPPAVTIERILIISDGPFAEWLRDRRNRRQIPHRMEEAGYVPVRNEADTHDGQWKINGKRQTVYALASLPLSERIAAAQALARE